MVIVIVIVVVWLAGGANGRIGGGRDEEGSELEGWERNAVTGMADDDRKREIQWTIRWTLAVVKVVVVVVEPTLTFAMVVGSAKKPMFQCRSR
mmetsp:Transcript_14426/g.30340  ORF Transcript_14426/g.30340 Transcript_14426/m.30340 type:complete len:93 (-) Transcript_14426:23-301(-)